jgi:Tfp pilus assembly protein PilO
MNEQLQQLETQLQEMSRGKRVAVYLVIFFSFIYMSWVLYSEELLDEIETTQQKISSLESKLIKNSTRTLERAILKSKKDVLRLEDDITHLHFQKQFVRTKLQDINFIFYDEKGSAEMLDDVLKFSVKKSINLESIQRISMQDIEHTLIRKKNTILIRGESNLESIISLEYFIENINALLEIKSLHVHITDDNSTAFEMNLIHYGVEL